MYPQDPRAAAPQWLPAAGSDHPQAVASFTEPERAIGLLWAGLLMIMSAMTGGVASVSDWVVDSALGTGRWRFSGVEVLSDVFAVRTGATLVVVGVCAVVLGVSGVLSIAAALDRRTSALPIILPVVGSVGWLVMAIAGWVEVGSGEEGSSWRFGLLLMTAAGVLGLLGSFWARRARRTLVSTDGTAMVTDPRAVGAVG